MATGGQRNGSTVSSTMAAIGSILASILRRDCAWRRLGRAGAEAVDEGLQMGAPLLLLLGRLALQRLLLAALALEAGIAAGPQGELAAVEMEDVVGDVVEQVAVVADDERSSPGQVFR